MSSCFSSQSRGIKALIVAIAFIPGSESTAEHQHDPPWADRFSFEYDGYDSAMKDDDIEDWFETDNEYNCSIDVNGEFDDGEYCMNEDAVFAWHHHANPTTLRFGWEPGHLSYIYEWDFAGMEDIDDLLLMTLVGCETGNDSGGQNNCVDSAVDAGVDCCVGFRETIYRPWSVWWEGFFFDHLINDIDTVDEAHTYARAMMLSTYGALWGTGSYVAKGDDTVKVIPASYGDEGGGGK